MAETMEEHWRVMLIDRLQKLENSVESVRTDLTDVKTSAAVSANESKSRSDLMSRVEVDIKELSKFVHSLERSLSEPKGQAEIERRVKDLETWQANLMGKLSVIGFFIAIATSLATTFFAKALGLS